MSLYEKNSTYVFVGNVAHGLSHGNAVSGQAAGSVLLEFENGTAELTTALSGATTTKVRVSQKKADGTVVKSPWFDYASILTKTSSDYSALGAAAQAAEQISYIGYDGTTVTGLGTITEGEVYQIAFNLMHTQGAVNNSTFVKHVPYEVQIGDTDSDLAFGLTDMAIKVLNRHMPEKAIKVERINGGAQAVALNNLSLTNGSVAFTSADDDTLTLVNGTILRIEEPENNGSAVTDPCYIVVGNDGGAGAARVYYLDIPFQGVTNADHDQCETVTEGEWGIKFTGIAQSFIPIRSEYHKVRFKMQLSGFDSNVANYTAQQAFEGQGVYEQVATLEKLAFFNEGRPFVEAYPPTITRSEAVVGEVYDLIMLEIKANELQSETVGIPVKSNMRIIIASKSSLDGNTNTWDTPLGVNITA